MTPIANWLANLATSAGTTPGEMAEVIVSGLGSFGTVLAAIAAWRAAKATQVSVIELKEGRLQAVRPKLVPVLNQQDDHVGVFWSSGQRRCFISGDPVGLNFQPNAERPVI